MKYNNKFIIYLLLILVLTAFLLSFCVGIIISHLKIAPETSQTPITLSKCVVYGTNIPYIPYIYTMGSLIDCLSYYESSNNPNAVGKAGEIGCLQFMPSTFQMYCVDKYEMTDDIWDCSIQRECCDKMLINGGINHWTTALLCK